MYTENNILILIYKNVIKACADRYSTKLNPTKIIK